MHRHARRLVPITCALLLAAFAAHAETYDVARFEGVGANPLPVLVTIHGGGFANGSKGHAAHVGHGEYSAARGFAVLSIDYRLEHHRPPADPEMLELALAYDPSRSPANDAAAHAAVVDTKTALRWVHAHADLYGFDSDRVFAVGSSAGGFSALIAGITAGDMFTVDLPGDAIAPRNHPDADSDLQAVINLWGGAGPWIDKVDAEDPPMLHVYGTEDWLYPEGEALRDRCLQVGATFEWVPLRGYGHGAWNAEILGMPREEAILDFLARYDLLGRRSEATSATPGFERAAIPWGAMYTPNEQLAAYGMTGVVRAYRGQRGADLLLGDLQFARDQGVEVIVTLGGVSPADYLDEEAHLVLDRVHLELAPFFALADEIRPFIADGTVWGIRFLDEPHDPAGYPRGFAVDPLELGEAYALILQHLGPVRVASTAPPWYLAQVPGAGFAFGQCVHGRLPDAYEDATAFHREQSQLAHDHELLYVASLNANTNPVDNLTFFRSYRAMCALSTVDFVTAWQWPQGHHPEASFAARLADPSPAVQAEVAAIPAACAR